MSALSLIPAILGGCQGEARAINGRGQVVGRAQAGGVHKQCGGQQDPFLWDDGTMTDLGLAASCSGIAYGVNDAGDVVGTCGGGYYPFGPFFWRAGRMYSLRELVPAWADWTLRVPYGIDDAGRIVASAVPPGQATTHAVLLVPN